jgi:hypothetical protein
MFVIVEQEVGKKSARFLARSREVYRVLECRCPKSLVNRKEVSLRTNSQIDFPLFGFLNAEVVILSYLVDMAGIETTFPQQFSSKSPGLHLFFVLVQVRLSVSAPFPHNHEVIYHHHQRLRENIPRILNSHTIPCSNKATPKLVLTKRKRLLLENFHLLQNEGLSLLHKLQPPLLRLLHANWEFLHFLKNQISQFSWKHRIDSTLTPNLLPPPILSLTRHIRRADDLDIRINQKECENFPVAWLRSIFELERLNLMLQNVGEGQQSAFARVYDSNVLERRPVLVTPEYVREPFVLVLSVHDPAAREVAGVLAKRER